MKEISAQELRIKLNNKETMLVDFYATFPIYKVNVEEDIDLSQLMSIRSVPALKFIKEGEIMSTSIGLKSAKEINSLITETIL